jgi:phage terminase large subunit-like protein
MPLVHSTRLPEGAKFSHAKADRVVNFIQKAGVHTKSGYARKKFILDDWQAGSVEKDENGVWELDGIIRPLFGAQRWSSHWKKWVRQYTMAWLEMARKNGKSELMAALGLYLLIFDGEESAEIYSAAADREQAAQVFDVARDMVYLSPMLSKMKDKGELLVIDSRKRIVYTPTRSFYKVIAADAAGNLGANPHGILFDEVLAQPNNELWNYMRQGMGTRPQPLLIAVTTAGPSRESFAYGEHEFGLRVAVDPDLDKKRFVYMAFVDEHADWKDESKWPEGNPALGSFLDIQMIRDEMQEILNKGDLSAIAHFKIFRLNQWGVSQNLWLDMAVWEESEATAGSYSEDDLKGIHAVGGFDMAETMDLTAWVLVFYDEDRVMIKPHFWITKKALQVRHKRRMDNMLRWISEGYITLESGDVHDYDKIRDRMLADISTYGVEMFGYDPFQAPAIINHLEAQSNALPIKVPQFPTRMDPGSKELTRLMGLRILTSNDNPVLKWNVANAGYKSDSEGHIKPHKENSTGNIDGITALVNALSVKVTTPIGPQGNIFVFDEDELQDDDDD